MKKKNIIYVVMIVSVLSVFNIDYSFSAIEMLSDEELSDVDGQFSEIKIVNHLKKDDTVRIFLDIHNEVYGTIDSVRAGYYYKETSQLGTTPIQIGLSGYEGYYHGLDDVNQGANFAFFKVLSDFNTMSPANGASLQPWGNGAFDSSNAESRQATATKNINNFDWDLWIDNIQVGESPDKPLYSNGVIIRLEFDNSIYSENPHLQRIVIGSNDTQGNLYFNAQRLTGAISALVVTNTTNRSAGAVDPYKATAGVPMFQRDPMAQCFGVGVQNVEDRDTGTFLLIDLEGDHLGLSLVIGYPENATDFNFTGSVGSTGLEGIDIFSPQWSRYSPTGSGMSGGDPYNTTPPEDYDGNDSE